MRPLYLDLRRMFGPEFVRQCRIALRNFACDALDTGRLPEDLRAHAKREMARAVAEAAMWGGSDEQFTNLVSPYERIIAVELAPWRERDQAKSYVMEDLWRSHQRVASGTRSRPYPTLFCSRGPYAPLMREFARRAALRTTKRRKLQIEFTWPANLDDLWAPPDSGQRLDSDESWLLEQLLIAKSKILLTGIQFRVIQVRWSGFKEFRFVPSQVIASELGITVNAVNTAYSRAKKMLREHGIDLDRAEQLCRSGGESVRSARRENRSVRRLSWGDSSHLTQAGGES
ncbi:MAG: hypothetical protein IT457_12440 [Planctomycetes bacterium]|nr:hypothetical protein [Planctomycetota bacterium]